MKAINVSGGPLYCSYAKRTVGGVTLQAGQATAELPLSVVFMDILWKDIENGRVIIRLAEADKEFIAQLQSEDQRPVPAPKKSTRPASVLPQARAKRVKQPKAPKQPTKAEEVAKVAHTPGMPRWNAEKAPVSDILRHMGENPTSKDLQAKSAIPSAVVTPASETSTYGRPPSLADLKKANANQK